MSNIPQGSTWSKPTGRGTMVEHHEDGTVLAWALVSLYPPGAAMRRVEGVLRGPMFKNHPLAEGSLRIEGDFAIARTKCLTHSCDGEIL